MGIQYENNNIPVSFASCSIPAHFKANLPEKLEAIRNAGFDGIEMSMPDILEYGKSLNGQEIQEDDYDAIVEVSKKIRMFTDQIGLEILMLQPFSRFEGWTDKQKTEREDAFNRARGWIKVMEALGTDMLQVGSSDAEGISSSFDTFASDLRELADMLASKGFRLAYENWCWASHASTWKDIWSITQRTGQPNVGLCLDTFQSAGGEWGDPSTESGRLEAYSESELNSRWKQSLDELQRTVDKDKIYLLQVSDAYRMKHPIQSDEARERSLWSHDWRPLPHHGGYLPIQDFFNAVMATGFRGWLSMEVFDSKPQEGLLMEDYTKAAMQSLTRMLSNT